MWWDIEENQEEIAFLRSQDYEDYEIEDYYCEKMFEEWNKKGKITNKQKQWNNNHDNMIAKYGKPKRFPTLTYESQELWKFQNQSKVVYCITNLANNKKYVGKTKSTFNLRYKGSGIGIERVYNHMVYNSSGNQHLLNSIVKYGFGAFKVEILCVCDSDFMLCKKEKHYISLYKTSQKEYGYNKTNGGDGVELSSRTRFNNLMTGASTKKIEKLILKGVITYEEIVELLDKPITIVYKNGKDANTPYNYKTLRIALNGKRKQKGKKHSDYLARGEMITKILYNHGTDFKSLPKGKSYVEVYLTEDFKEVD